MFAVLSNSRTSQNVAPAGTLKMFVVLPVAEIFQTLALLVDFKCIGYCQILEHFGV